MAATEQAESKEEAKSSSAEAPKKKTAEFAAPTSVCRKGQGCVKYDGTADGCSILTGHLKSEGSIVASNLKDCSSYKQR